MTIRAALAALILGACAPAGQTQAQAQTGAEGPSLFRAEPAQQWRLPAQLREISGMAATSDGRIFAHDDERAVIYELDVAAGAIIKTFVLGDPVETGDFEGLAITPDGAFHMITSRGAVYSFREGADGAVVPFTRANTQLRDVCEIEGLAYFAAEDSLIIACKENKPREMRDTISLYAWRPGADAPAQAWLNLPQAALTAAAGVRRFRPSSIEFDPRSGRLLLLSARDGALVELSRDGEVLAARALSPAHIQAEAVGVTPEGALLIGDEGGDGAALLSLYGRQR